MYFLICD